MAFSSHYRSRVPDFGLIWACRGISGHRFLWVLRKTLQNVAHCVVSAWQLRPILRLGGLLADCSSLDFPIYLVFPCMRRSCFAVRAICFGACSFGIRWCLWLPVEQETHSNSPIFASFGCLAGIWTNKSSQPHLQQKYIFLGTWAPPKSCASSAHFQ